MKNQRFTRKVDVDAAADALFAWHARPGAFERLTPPWEAVSIRDRSGSIRDGDTLDLEVRLGPVSLRWRARHQDYVEGVQFCDVQEGGPFSLWKHVHRVEATDAGARLEDAIEFRLPLAPISHRVAGSVVRAKLDRMFQYRHRTTRDDLAAHTRYAQKEPIRVAVTGSTGLVGSALVPFLTTGGHTVTRVRRSDEPNDPWAASDLSGADAVVNLAGESIDGRWTAGKKARIRSSRVDGTAALVRRLTALDEPPAVLVCASAIGFYGDRGDEMLPETADRGTGFLSDVCEAWEATAREATAREATAREAAEAGIRVVNLRFGVILSGKGGALAKMLTPFKLGLGGRIGNGRQYMSWVALDDAVGAIHHAMMVPEVSGPVNVVAPEAVTNRAYTKALGRVLSRPTIAPMPAFAARAAFGEMADALLLSSARCVPERLTATGYGFRYPELEDALAFQVGRMVLSGEFGG